ncbi:TPA: hypothetical protein NGU48_000592 [Vibrio parahaemolyticus]|uniref:hypothetical protein n=1 Tax=Vibrio parahaemolyticus TaxID=670 RepID=UPI001E5D0F18|nr:hypothetical protein [Vibrio parahaemolyticus]HCE2668630.1 hypothetical protein [Vibrio parahaemolyticus]HCE4613055.1 hypothetical protein [Vibrio parahaemolyticus]HCG8762378.1 hypothetical protein [Vibrio parahaemolyticus]
MSKIVWTSETLTQIRTIDFLWHVINNFPESSGSKAYLGNRGELHSPNYQIEELNGNVTTYLGRSHKKNDKEPYYAHEHLSKQGFELSELMEIFDNQPKGPEAAKQMMSDYWKKNKNKYSTGKSVNECRDQIIELSVKGTPISKAFELVFSLCSKQDNKGS